MKSEFDIIIVGAGLVGLTAALALSQAGFKTAIIDSKIGTDNPRDPRASTLAASSFQLMKNLGLATALTPHIQPIDDMMIGEGRPGLISPLTLHFDGQKRSSSMAYMIENNRLMTELSTAAATTPNLAIHMGSAMTGCEFDSRCGALTLASGETLSAKLIVAADGRNSAVRHSANIAVETRPYDQSAIVTTVEHERDHNGVAYQMFFPGGPFAILPLTGRRASIVWSDKTSAVHSALALGDEAFAAELARRFGDHLGADVAALTEVLTRAKATGLDIGGAELAEYGQWRRADNRMLAVATDQLNQLFTSRITPIRHLRRLGLSAVDKSSLAQIFFMSEAAGENGDLPPLLT